MKAVKDLTLSHLCKRQLKEGNETTLIFKGQEYSIKTITDHTEKLAEQLKRFPKKTRIVYFAPKSLSSVVSLIASALSDLIFIPINPLLKPDQVIHILKDSGATILIVDPTRYRMLIKSELLNSFFLHIFIDNPQSPDEMEAKELNADLPELGLTQVENNSLLAHQIDQTSCILYTSGSTGKPKGVAISEKNLILGAKSVCQYLGITNDDRLLALLPFSFDYGLNQVLCSLYSGADLVIHDYIFPADIKKIITQYQVTGLAGVPSLWNAISNIKWEESEGTSVRFITNSGGKLPLETLSHLTTIFKQAAPYLMYGLTESFRSTYLKPELSGTYPSSIGTAIPYASVYVIGLNGKPSTPYEHGEIVHCGPLVTLGYWNNSEETNKRFKPAPSCYEKSQLYPLAVWSGDKAYIDENNLIYFVGRNDNLIKKSGYRVSPDEIESTLYESGMIKEAFVFSLADETEETKIYAIIRFDKALITKDKQNANMKLKMHCSKCLPNYMVPDFFIGVEEIPKNPNGKYDRNLVIQTILKNTATLNQDNGNDPH